MSSKLPPEIWHHISSYLSPVALQRICMVNRVLFELAMNTRYRSVWIEKENVNLPHLLEVLKEPDMAKRVHSFYLDPDMSVEPLDFSTNQPKKATRFQRIVWRVRKRLSPKKHPNALGGMQPHYLTTDSGVLADFMVIIPLLVNIKSFELSWSRNLPTQISSPNFNFLWSCLSATLTDLRCTATTGKLDEIFTSFLRLPKLKVFHVKILCPIGRIDDPLADITGKTQDLLAVFINSLSSSLEDLAVSCDPIQNLSPLYGNLGNFATLTSVKLDTSLPASPELDHPTGLTTFIQRINPTLNNLILSTSLPFTSTNSYQFRFSDLLLTNLRSITISAEIMALSWSETNVFLKLHSPFLESLEITGPIALTEIGHLMNSVGHTRNPGSSLSRFSLESYSLHPPLLSMLSMHLPRLASLQLKIKIVTYTSPNALVSFTPEEFFPNDHNNGYSDGLPNPAASSFKQSLESLDSIREWELQDLTLMRRSCCGELILWGLLLLCAECIPSMSSFLGNGDMCIPNPPNKKPRLCRLRNGECLYGIDRRMFHISGL